MSFIASQYLPTSPNGSQDPTGSKPSFFEIIAHEQILPGLKAATRYVLSLMVQRNFSLFPLLRYHDEIFLFFQILTEYHYLENYHASFSEYLYNMKRVPLLGGGAPNHTQQQQQDGTKQHTRHSASPLHSWRQGRLLSILFTVFIPYLKHKLHLHYLHLKERSQQEDSGDGDSVVSERGDTHAQQQHGSSRDHTRLSLIRLLTGMHHKFKTLFNSQPFKDAFLTYWPYINGASESLCFIHLLGYLFDDWNYHSPFFRIQALTLRRLTMRDLMQHKNNLLRKRVATITNLRNRAALTGTTRYIVLYRIAEYCIRFVYKVSDYSRALLLSLVFLFKFFEWYYASEHLRTSHKTVFVPDRPPKPPKCKDQSSLPANNILCPLCKEARSNPTLLTKSGFVFCYKCIHQYLKDVEEACPVSGLPATHDDLRRLFE